MELRFIAVLWWAGWVLMLLGGVWAQLLSWPLGVLVLGAAVVLFSVGMFIIYCRDAD